MLTAAFWVCEAVQYLRAGMYRSCQSKEPVAISHMYAQMELSCHCFADCAGAVLPIWKVLAETVISGDERYSKNDSEMSDKKESAKVVRCQLDSGEPIVGLSLHHDDVAKVSKLPALR